MRWAEANDMKFTRELKREDLLLFHGFKFQCRHGAGAVRDKDHINQGTGCSPLLHHQIIDSNDSIQDVSLVMILIQLIEGDFDLLIVTSESDQLLPEAGEHDQGSIFQATIAHNVIQQDMDPFDGKISNGISIIRVREQDLTTHGK